MKGKYKCIIGNDV